MARGLLDNSQNMPRDTRTVRARATRAFTLVELMIVVAIIGVLSIIAVVAYRKFILSAKIAEAQNMIGAIRIAQEDFKAERGSYADVGAAFCPSTGLTQTKTQWNPGCVGGGTLANWAALPVHADGQVQFGYSVVARPAALPAVGWVDMTAAIPRAVVEPWYVIRAQADLDGNGGLNTEFMASSFDNRMYSRQEGN